MKSGMIALAGLFLVALAPNAWALGKGSSMFSLHLTSGTADLVAPGHGDYITAFDHSELGVQGEYWLLMADDYAVTLAVGVAGFKETDEPGDSSGVNKKNREYSQNSFSLRIGGDRVLKLGDRAIAFFGPGIEYWSGKMKAKNIPAFPSSVNPIREDESETVTRVSLSGRLGGTMLLSESVGISGHVGAKAGYASVEDKGAKATWWPSSFDAALGLQFLFGGQ